MKLKVLTVASDEQRVKPLINSLEKQSYDYHVVWTEWKGFGTKLLAVRDYLLANPDCESFVFCDAYDVLCLGKSVEYPIDEIIFSCEKNCWPSSELATDYPPTDSIYKYVNSGLYYAPRDLFLDLFEWNTPDYTTDDQLWATRQYLYNRTSKIKLDTNCQIFQSYSFIADDEYTYEDSRLINNYTGTMPTWVHGNGTTDMTKVLELIK